MKTLSTITIGIPAYNEADSIGGLIQDLLAQKVTNGNIKEIIVGSDCSDDDTVKIVKSFRSPKIRVIERKVRGGKAEVMNQIASITKSDILVILDADISLPDSGFIEKLVMSVVSGKADLASANETTTAPVTFFEKILAVSVSIKRDVFFHYKNGQNFYTCHGQARAFSKKLYTHLRFPFSAGEDMYSYVYCLVNGYKYQFVSDAYVVFHLPRTYKDHERQSIRFSQAIQKVNAEFGRDRVKELTHIPWSNVLYWSARHFIKNPFAVTLNIVVFAAAKVRSLVKNGSQNTWAMVSSTKHA